MFDKILLVPSSDSLHQPAVRRLLSLAPPGAQVEVFSPVHDPHLDGYLGHEDIYQSLRERVVREQQARVAGLARKIAATAPVRTTAAALWDRPYEEAVIRRAMHMGADTVLLSPRTAGSAALLHSDWRLISLCPVPLLLVKSDGTRGYRNIVAAVDPLHRHAKPAELDESILECAKSVQALTRAELTVAHCFVPLAPSAADVGGEHLPIDDVERRLGTERQRALDQLLEKTGVAARTLLSEGRPDVVLRSMAEKGEADLIVMGALSRGRLKDFIIGSTAERVLQQVDVDVLIIKPPGFESPVRTAA